MEVCLILHPDNADNEFKVMIVSEYLCARCLFVTEKKGALQGKAGSSASLKRSKSTSARERGELALSPRGHQHIFQTFLPRTLHLQSVLRRGRKSPKSQAFYNIFVQWYLGTCSLVLGDAMSTQNGEYQKISSHKE